MRRPQFLNSRSLLTYLNAKNCLTLLCQRVIQEIGFHETLRFSNIFRTLICPDMKMCIVYFKYVKKFRFTSENKL